MAEFGFEHAKFYNIVIFSFVELLIKWWSFSLLSGTKKGNNLNLLIGLLQKGLEASSHHSDAYSQLIHKVWSAKQFVLFAT